MRKMYRHNSLKNKLAGAIAENLSISRELADTVYDDLCQTGAVRVAGSKPACYHISARRRNQNARRRAGYTPQIYINEGIRVKTERLPEKHIQGLNGVEQLYSIRGKWSRHPVVDQNEGYMSKKPWNILVNYKKIPYAAASVALTVSSLPSGKTWLLVSGILVTAKTILDLADIRITKEQACVLTALWRNCNAYGKISEKDGFEAVKSYLSIMHENPMDECAYNRRLDELMALKAIDITGGIIQLKEKIVGDI